MISTFILKIEPWKIALPIFTAVFLILWERKEDLPRVIHATRRKCTNVLMAVSSVISIKGGSWLLSTLFWKTGFPGLGLYAFAAWAETNPISMISLHRLGFSSPYVLTLLTFVILDLALYWQHRFFHRFSFFWKFHKPHHSDRELDWTSGLRFHPAEIILSQLFKIGVILVFGFPSPSVLQFEIFYFCYTLFTHARVRMPMGVHQRVGHILITPQHHRIHHILGSNRCSTNFGGFLSIWDHVFRTWKPISSQDFFPVGELDVPTNESTRFDHTLKSPWISKNSIQN